MLQLQNAAGERGSTRLGAAVVGDLLGAEIDPATWRRDYRRHFAELAEWEFADFDLTPVRAAAGLAGLHSAVRTPAGATALELAAAGWREPAAVVTVAVRGSAAPRPLQPTTLKLNEWIAAGAAEPGLAAIAELSQLPTPSNLLFAIAAGAECAPTNSWLQAGGRVAAVMRPGASRWAGLIKAARAGAGELLVPVPASRLPAGKLDDAGLAAVAGLDAVAEVELVAGWLAQLAAVERLPVVVAGYGYTPGAGHIVLQAAQDAVMATALEQLPPAQVALTWLGTPTDITPVPTAVSDARAAAYAERSWGRRLADSPFRALGWLRPPIDARFLTAAGTELALVDSSVRMQGPNYLWAKRSQRWRAYAAAAAGAQVVYTVFPPARTDSVLRHRSLRAAYRGAPRFGIRPAGADFLDQGAAVLLAAGLAATPVATAADPTAVHLQLAVHGGLWRLTYDPSSAWLPAGMVGWPGWFERRP